MKQVGSINGVPVYEDPNAPPGTMYLCNDKHIEFAKIDTRSRWQRIRDWLRKHLGDSWLIILVFVVSMSILLFWTWKWHTLPCSSFKTNPILRGGYAPGRCIDGSL